jgi:hypothetical protein
MVATGILLFISAPRITILGESSSLAVGNPDVFHLNGMLEEPAAFALFGIEPVDGAAFVRERLL